MEFIYLAYQKNQLQFYSYDINEFFEYLRNLYQIKPDLEYEIRKIDITKSDKNYQSLYPMLELENFHNSIYMPIWDCRIWDEYFDGFYQTTLEILKKIHQKIPTSLENFDAFMNHLGPDRIRSIIGSGIVHSFLDYEQYQELCRKK